MIKTERQFTILFLGIYLCAGLFNLPEWAMAPKQSTPSGKIKSHEQALEQPALIDLNNSIHYRKTPGMNTKLASMYEKINVTFDIIQQKIQAFSDSNENHSTNFSFLHTIASSPSTQIHLAERANIDPDLIQHYLSRALAINLKYTTSKKEQLNKVAKLTTFPKTAQNLPATAVVEDAILGTIYKTRNLLNIMISYQQKAPTCFIPIQAKNRIKNFNHHFSQYKKLILTNKQESIYKQQLSPINIEGINIENLKSLINSKAPKDPQEPLNHVDIKVQRISIENVKRLLNSADVKIQAIGYHTLYTIYLIKILNKINGGILSLLKGFYQQIANHINILSQSHHSYTNTMQSLNKDIPPQPLDQLSYEKQKQIFSQHTISHLSQFFSDRMFIPITYNFTSILYLAEEMLDSSRTISSITIDIELRKKIAEITRDPFIENIINNDPSIKDPFIESIRLGIKRKEYEYKLANLITQFLDNYENECLPYDKPAIEKGIKSSIAQKFDITPENSSYFFRASKPYIAPWKRDELLAIEEKNNDWRDECSIAQLLRFSGNDPKIIDYITKKRFPPQKPPHTSRKPNKKKGKKGKNEIIRKKIIDLVKLTKKRPHQRFKPPTSRPLNKILIKSRA